MKQIDFHTFKNIRRMTLRDFNKWLSDLCSAEFAAGKQKMFDESFGSKADFIAEIITDELYEKILSVKGIGEKRANEIMEAILNDETTA